MYSYDEVYSATLEYFGGDDLAANVFVSKYALKDKEGNYLEKTPDDMHKRMAREFARIEIKYGGKRALNEETIYGYFNGFNKICPQGSPMYGIGNNYSFTSLSNCLVIKSPDDNISSIFESGKNIANLSKARAGVGMDISTLRPEGSKVSNAAGTSTGAWSFSDFYSNIARLIGQDGRRAALILTMDIKHPDIEKFITMKKDLKKVTGANISVKLSDEFMNAVEKDGDFQLQFPIDSTHPIYTRIVKAREVWNLIVETATNFAEPGLLFWDTVIRRLPAESYKEFKTVCVNPCAEIDLSEFDSCRLISINLKNFVSNPFSKSSKFNFKGLENTCSVVCRLGDDLVDLEVEKLEKIINKIDNLDEKSLWTTIKEKGISGRRIGIGTHGLADAIACLNLSYDSDEALKIVDKIYETLKESVYAESVKLSEERGSFPVFDWNKEKDNEFIKDLSIELQESIKQYGRRNISLLTNAPTGSVSILSQTSSGIEPVFKNSYIRRRKINHNENITPDFVDALGDKWIEFEVFHKNIKDWMRLNPDNKLPEFFVESDNINWTNRVKLQATAQKHIDHSISSTINLPKETTSETVGQIYMEAWKSGCKGATIYRAGSRDGVLLAKKEEVKKDFTKDAPKRPDYLDCNIHHISVKGQKWLILVGLLNNRPYEVFGGMEENVEIPKKYTTGKIFKFRGKNDKNRYDLYFGEDGCVKDITKMFDNPNYQTHTRLISLSLRHGAKVNFLVEQLIKDPDSDLTSFSSAISRVLKKYIEEGTKVSSDKICENCGQESLEYSDGCKKCNSCGWSKCG